MASADLIDELSCSICLNIYTDPVTLSCGHNFCRECINIVLDKQAASGPYTCPECREQYEERPLLYNARALQNIAEKFLIYKPQQEATGIFCSYCMNSPVPALKTCLLCETSMCGKHLAVHIKSPEHILSSPTKSPEKRKCAIHKKVMEYYCSKEKVCICVYCIAVGEHKGHQVESLNDAYAKKKAKLGYALEEMTLKKLWVDEQAQSLQERRTDLKKKTAGITARVVALFKTVRKDLDVLEKKVLSELSKQEEKIFWSVSDLIKQLDMQKEQLSQKMDDIKSLSNTPDPMAYLQGPCLDGHDISHTELKYKLDTLMDTSDLHEGLITDRLNKMSEMIKYMHVELQQPTGVLLDRETASHSIHISNDLKTASLFLVPLNYPESCKRFEHNQVQSTRSYFSGRHYFEVDTSNSYSWRLGLCYSSIDRKSFIGERNDAWCLRRCGSDYKMMHDNRLLPLPHHPTSHKFSIALDYEAGQISFYEMCYPVLHLHTFNATFTEPLCLSFALWIGSLSITN